MQTSDALVAPASASAPLLDARFARSLVLLNGAIPLLILGWDAAHHQLGVNAVNHAIHTTGLLGLLFLVLSLAITPLRRLTGRSELIASRRALGLYAFFYLALHFGIFFGLDRDASVESTVHEILTRRYLQIGTVGLLLLVPLAVTSTDRMVTRLGARRWKRLHRWVYVSAIAGSVHYILLVKADLRKPVAFAVVLGVLLVARAAFAARDRRARSDAHDPSLTKAPDKPRFWAGELRVLEVFEETPDVRTFRLAAEGGGPLPFSYQPGQYLTLDLLIDGARVRRSYTIASSPSRPGSCELTVKKKSDGYVSGHLHATLKPGARVKIVAPAGRFVFTGEGAEQVVFIAGGVGITPLMSMVRYLADAAWRGHVYLFIAARRERDVIFRNELAHLAARLPNLHVHITLSGEEGAEWAGPRGRLTGETLAKLAPGIARGPVYLCGPDAMMTATRASLLALGVPERSILTEAFVSPGAFSPSELDVPAPLGEVAPAGIASLHFARSGKSLVSPGKRTLLEAAESLGLDLPFECRSGICGQCKTKVLRGHVVMDAEDALSREEKAEGIVLACQAHPIDAVVVDA